MEPDNEIKAGRAIIGSFTLLILLILVLIVLFSIFVQVPAGRVGVVTTFGKVTGLMPPGLHVKAPIGIQSVTKIDTRVQKADVKAEAGSKDLQTVNTDIVLNYHLDTAKIDTLFQTIGNNKEIEEKIIGPAVSEVVKASVAQKSAEEILTKRPDLKADIDNELKNRLLTYHVVVDDVSIVNVDFTEEFNKAIEAKQIAEQNAQKAIYDAQQASASAQATINKARGEAEAQRLQQQTLTTELLQKYLIDKWDGHYPTTLLMGQNQNTFLPLPTK